MRTVLNAGHDVAFGRAVGSEFVGEHHTGCLTLSFQKLSHQTFGGLGITAALHQYIENEAILIDARHSQCFLPVMEMTTSSRYHLSPSFRAERRRISLAKWRPNFLTRRRAVWCETMIPHAASKSSTIRKLSGKRRNKPDGMSNHFSGEPVAAIKGITNGLGHAVRKHNSLDSSLNLQCH